MNEDILKEEREKLKKMKEEKAESVGIVGDSQEVYDYQKMYNDRNNKNKNKKSRNGLFLILVVIISFVGGLLGTYVVLTYFSEEGGTITTGLIELSETNSISSAVDKVYNSVVVVEGYAGGVLTSTGTGFAYKEDKKEDIIYVMTNNHVVADMDSIKLILSDGTYVDASVVGADLFSDIAVLEIEKTDRISIAKLGDNEKMKLGDTVFTLGSPEGSGYAGTVTKGVLSGKDRLVPVSFSSSSSSDYLMSVIQTDAAINPGNSGGPLFNVNGEVIGITNMKLVDDKVEGMGFAIPIEDAIYYAELLELEGKVSRPYLGIQMADIIANSYYLWREGIIIPSGIDEGVVIYSVENNSPADDAGLKKGDIILKMDDKDITSLAELRYMLYKNYDVGEEVSMTINRNNKEEVVKITLGASE